MRLVARSVPRFDRPVTLPPGRASEATRPLPIGSPAVGKTIGMLDVACFAAIAGGTATSQRAWVDAEPADHGQRRLRICSAAGRTRLDRGPHRRNRVPLGRG